MSADSSADVSTIDDEAQYPDTIISLSPGVTEILYAIGAGEAITGVTDHCNFPKEALEKEKIGGFKTVSVEKVVALQPDLVLATEGTPPEVFSRLEDAGIQVEVFEPESMADVKTMISEIGNLTGYQTGTEELLNRIDEIESNILQNTNEKPKIAHIIWKDPLYGSGKNTFQDEIITRSGGENALIHVEGHAPISIEDLIISNPDIILVNSGSGMGSTEGSSLFEYITSESRLSSLNALKNNAVYEVDSDSIDRPGPRLWDILEQISEYIHRGE